MNRRAVRAVRFSAGLVAAAAVGACNAVIGSLSDRPRDAGVLEGSTSPDRDGATTLPEGSTTIDDGAITIAPPVLFGKVDLLFDIDNSASMGDKQTYLVQAIPDLVTRLVTPRCVDAQGNPTGTNATLSGQCTQGTPEFQPVTDMHIGVVTSALGSRGGIVEAASGGNPAIPLCDPTGTIPSKAGYVVSAYNDDQGHLINRTGPNGSGAALAEATPSSFLYWYPPTSTNTTPAPGATPITSVGAAGTGNTLLGDFTELARGAGQSGCGIESQLESWYRFLIQPDPYASISTTSNAAEWVGVDSTLIQQRHDFLRPDSVVAVVVLTDENDSEIDVRSYGGSGYLILSNTYSPQHGTSACEVLASSVTTGPNDPACTASEATYTAYNDWGFNLNLRHVHMKAKYGIDPQFPLMRYVNGLTSPLVPNRAGEYPSGAQAYTGTNNCVNPLFAASLPTAADATDANIGTSLCKLTPGSRTAGDVFFLHIGGVPHELLQATPGGADGSCAAGTAQADCPTKAALAPADWVKILGSDPIHYGYAGIDPHMIESYLPRTQLSTQNPNQAPATNPLIAAAVATSGGVGGLTGPSFTTSPFVDPINGREWITNAGAHSLPVDRQYACIFQLPPALQRDCSTLGSNANDTLEYNSCDCTGVGDTPEQVPPLCDKSSSDGTITSSVNDYTVQVYAKAYPTVRELTLAMMLGNQGVVGSLCPIHTVDNAGGNDPVFGYRPAMNSLVDRMKVAIAAQAQ